MSDLSACETLNAALERREFFIDGLLVARAMHELITTDLEAADDLERSLERRGYTRSKRGDWNLFE